MKIFKPLAIGAAFVLFIFASCQKQQQFTIEGVVSEGDGAVVYLEKRGLGDIIIIDSAKLADDGRFSFNGARLPYPEFFSLIMGKQSINLSVDSTETITIEASKNNFATDYKVEGSESSARMKEVSMAHYNLNKEINGLKTQYNNKQLSGEKYLEEMNRVFASYKDKIKRLIIADTKSPAAYFALFQKIDGYLIFDPYDKDDSKIYSAVTTAWDFNYKEAPRTRHLVDYTLSSIKQRRSEERKNALLESAGETTATDFYNIDLPDLTGKNISLSSLKGKVVLLDFTVYQEQNSPAHNIAINRIYEKNKANMEVYQVSLDTDAHFWANSAANIPWICVRDNQSLSSSLIYRFNIRELPTMYLLDKEGSIVKRVLATDNLESEIRKLF